MLENINKINNNATLNPRNSCLLSFIGWDNCGSGLKTIDICRKPRLVTKAGDLNALIKVQFE